MTAVLAPSKSFRSLLNLSVLHEQEFAIQVFPFHALDTRVHLNRQAVSLDVPERLRPPDLCRGLAPVVCIEQGLGKGLQRKKCYVSKLSRFQKMNAECIF